MNNQSSFFKNRKRCLCRCRFMCSPCEKNPNECPERDKDRPQIDKECKIKGFKKIFWLYPFIGFGGLLRALKLKNRCQGSDYEPADKN